MKKILLTLMAAAMMPVLAMAQGCPPSEVTATVTLQFTGPGMLDGEFSVSDVKKVNFSQGNLQYQASTNTWQFAEHQWDYIGNAAGNNTAVADRATQAAWIDLFGWGTSGSPASNIYGYMPYYTVADSKHYGPGIVTNNLDWTKENSDWGTVNAVQLGLGWHTLSKTEWNYLLTSRPNATNLRAYATVHGVPGLLLLPDTWNAAESRISTPLTVNSWTNFTTNTISDDDWTILEFEGAVFLPAAGRRNGVTMSYVTTYGYYWTCTASDYRYSDTQIAAYSLYFRAGITPAIEYYSSETLCRHYGHSVRLVK